MRKSNKLYFVSATILLLIVAIAIGLYLSRNKSPLYVALGDSVAAGLGLKTPSDENNGCGRTEESYPSLIAYSENYELQNLACSGATVSEGILGPQKVEGSELPSQFEQLRKFSKPELITVTIGANDIDWTEPIMKCFLATCGSEEETAAIAQKLATLETNLTSVFEDISNLYDDQPPKVIMTSYYTIADQSNSTCGTLSGVTNDEIEWVSARFNDLNKAIETTAAEYPFVSFAQLEFENKGLCTYEAWVQGVGSPAPLHPTAAGQEAIKKAVVNLL
jgi:lysophospholipase L1-like esterase